VRRKDPPSPRDMDKTKKAIAGRGRTFEDIRDLDGRLLRLLIRPDPIADILPGVLRLLLEAADCDAVELHFREGNRLSRWAGRWRERRYFHFEILPALPWNGPRPDAAPLERICLEVLAGKLDPAVPGATPGGSFRTGDTQRLPATRVGRRDLGRSASPPPDAEFLSLAVVPLRAGEEAAGLLLLRSRARDAFGEETAAFFEAVAPTAAVVLAARDAQAALRERLKELTCLYGIAKVVERSAPPLGETLLKAAELLPPAWQYPEFASARVRLDGRDFATPGFAEAPDRLVSSLVVRGRGRGSVEVEYRERKPAADEGPFLKEERSLLDAVARQLALVVEEKEAQEARIGLQEKLRHADRLATVGQLSASVAHDLNEPLSNILGFAQLAQKCPGLPEQAGQDLRKIITAALESREIVRKVLGFVRQKPQVRSALHLNRLVEEACSLFDGRCAKGGIQVVRDLAKDLPEIVADPIGVNQVLVNLVANAVQAMPRGGRLAVRTFLTGGRMALVVEDTGVGMDRDTVERIFEPFFTTKEAGEGTGLGLTVAREIVLSHGGTIQVDSTPGKGSRFEVLLPLDGGKEAPEASPGAGAP
jgi:two-component system NtrC family sensor kinase